MTESLRHLTAVRNEVPGDHYYEGFQGTLVKPEPSITQQPSLEAEATVFNVFAQARSEGEVTRAPFDAYDSIQAERMAGGE
jgi:hypothetical protein